MGRGEDWVLEGEIERCQPGMVGRAMVIVVKQQVPLYGMIMIRDQRVFCGEQDFGVAAVCGEVQGTEFGAGYDGPPLLGVSIVILLDLNLTSSVEEDETLLVIARIDSPKGSLLREGQGLQYTSQHPASSIFTQIVQPIGVDCTTCNKSSTTATSGKPTSAKTSSATSNV
ncbi:eukaryotic translation initiation factor-related [Striga asiatica]|uniref:Eukaryotic translation initiation factor-related n=1 Tax=Striga asiatica TaxID=4170 RepID=A0A5A7QVC7_STRAF|nr:eukaryotic translation initiation factor-related [Striga asiatica]